MHNISETQLANGALKQIKELLVVNLKPSFLKSTSLSNIEGNLFQLATCLKQKNKRLLEIHERYDFYYKNDPSQDSTFARKQVADFAVKLAKCTTLAFGPRLSFSTIIRSGSLYFLYYCKWGKKCFQSVIYIFYTRLKFSFSFSKF